MLILELSHVFDPHLNLAAEEFLLRHVVRDEPLLLFYVNEPAIVVGRNRNVYEEIDLPYVREMGIPVVRRLSGGGTVFHDKGNLNYSLITPDQELLSNFVAFTRPVINALADLGTSAEIRNRSSLFVNDRKVSGNAQYATAGKLVSHGTILVDVDLAFLRRALKPREIQIHSRAVQSVRSRVNNISNLGNRTVSLATVQEALKRHFVGNSSAVDCELSNADWQHINELALFRYRAWSWNFGRSPRFTATKRTNILGGELKVTVVVERGLIRAVDVDGTGSATVSWPALNDCLRGVPYDPDDMGRALQECAMIEAGDKTQLLKFFF